MFLSKKPYDIDRTFRKIVSVAFFVILYLIIKHLDSVLIPFILASILAYLIYPFVCLIQKGVKKRALAVILSIVSLLIFFLVIMAVLIPAIGSEVDNMNRLLKIYASDMNWLKEMPAELSVYIQQWSDGLNIGEWFKTDSFYKLVQSALPKIWKGLSGIFGMIAGLFGIVTIILYLVFILIDYEKIANGWQAFIPPNLRKNVILVANDFQKGMHAYFKAQTKIVFIVAVLFSIGFKIINLPLAIFLGIFIGLLNYIPYLQIAGIIPAMFCGLLLSLDTHIHFGFVVILILAVFLIVQFIQDVFLTPKIMGDLTGLNPAIMLLSLSIWGTLLGVLGMLIALPLTTLGIAYYKRFVLETKD